MNPSATWRPHDTRGELTTKKQNDLPDSAFAFPRQRKEPLTDAAHVRNALARFAQVKGVSDADRELAFVNIRRAAKHYGVDISAKDRHDLGKAA
jgi:hypothetical protein